MKVKLFFSVLLTGFISVFSFAQNKQETIKISQSNEFTSEFEVKQYDMSKANRPEEVDTSNFFKESNASSFANPTTRSENEEISIFATIEAQQWGVLTNIEDNTSVYFSSERNPSSFSLKTYDEELNVEESFTIALPASTNRAELLNHYSSSFFSNDASKEFMIYVHYFAEGEVGPEARRSEVWIINSFGEVLGKLEGNAVWAKYDNQGNKRLYAYNSEDYEEIKLSEYSVSDLESINTYTIDGDLLNYYVGVPFSFMTINGQERLVVSHYESILLDNETLEVYPDNSLIVKILDYDLEEVKSINLNIDSLYDDEPFLVPMAEFGLFYAGQGVNYNITSDVFNSDTDLEVVYGISYYHMMQDTEWTNYILAKENGEIIKELKEYIQAVNWDVLAIDGYDNQIGLLYGDDPFSPTVLGFFDIESWEIVSEFEADQGGEDVISDVFNRIPHQNTYHYLIALANWDHVGEDMIYGVINEYKTNGEVHKRHQLPLSPVAQLFEPFLTSNVLDPNMFTTENEDLYFMYAYEELVDSNRFYNLVIAKDVENVLVEFRGDTERGKLVGVALPEYNSGGGVDKLLGVQYTNDTNLIVDFYKLPLFGSLGIEDFEKVSFAIYPNPSVGIINVTSNVIANDIKIYSMTGKLLHSQSLNEMHSTVNISSLTSGIYIAHISLSNGTTQKAKIIKQ